MGKCLVCDGSGETMAGSGVYDCQSAGCNAAVERTQLEESTSGLAFLHPADALWIGYQDAKQSMLEKAKELGRHDYDWNYGDPIVVPTPDGDYVRTDDMMEIFK